jgi:hypothetical protein
MDLPDLWIYVPPGNLPSSLCRTSLADISYFFLSAYNIIARALSSSRSINYKIVPGNLSAKIAGKILLIRMPRRRSEATGTLLCKRLHVKRITVREVYSAPLSLSQLCIANK